MMIKTETMLITKRKAMEMLETPHEGQQRRLSNEHVNNIASILESGQWQNMNGDTIVVDTKHRVIDGQHRLMAVIKTGIAIKTIVVSGVNPDAYYTIDLGGKKRSAADVLKIEGIPNAALMASAISFLWRYKNEFGRTKRNIKPTSKQIVDIYLKSPNKFQAAAKIGMRCKRFASPAQTAFLYYICREQDIDCADEFFGVFTTGITRNPYHPAKILREKFMMNKASKSKWSTSQTITMGIRAWNYYRKEKNIKHIKVPPRIDKRFGIKVA